ncbi:MAG: enzyme of heme biosynthesis [Methylobacter sp.]|nr:MAG: enzyme of heme biosynthesis [Methylobacter sp.]
MAELGEQQKQEVGETIKAHRSRNGFWFSIIILLIIASVAGAGFYLFMQLRDRQEGLGGEVKGQMSKQIADYQNQLTAIQNQLAALETDISSKDERFSKTLADFSLLHNEKLDNTRKELDEAIQRIQRQLGKTRGDWLIADAEYLLSVANERLHLIGDVNTTREALEAADQRLRESGDVGVIKVREQIAKDIALIRSLDVPDIVGIYASIQGLESSADKLSLLLPYSGKSLVPSTEIHDHADSSEAGHDMLQSVIDHLEGIVTIRHSDQPVKEILTPEQAQFIHEQLRVKLEMIKIALVEHNEAIYQASLLDAKNWLEQHFTKNEESRVLLSELERLMAIKIRSQFPDISQSFKMLRDIAKLRLEADKGMKTEEPVVAPLAPPVQTPPLPTMEAPAQTPPVKTIGRPGGKTLPEAQ